MKQKQKWIKTVSGVIVTATAVLAMLAGGNVARGAVLTRAIQNNFDDMEESLNIVGKNAGEPDFPRGATFNSSDLEVGADGQNIDPDPNVFGSHWQVVGVQYDQLGIPQGSTINSAKVTFTFDEITVDGDGSPLDNAMTILAELAPDASVFDPNNDFDITDRALTSASVAWAPPTCANVGCIGNAADTPDLTSMIQEVVNQAGWSDNNRLTVMIYPDVYLALADPNTGGDTLLQETTYDAGPGVGAPTLVIDFTPKSILTLQVNTVTGGMTMLGDPNNDIDINYYEITSAGSSVDPNGWNSLADQGFEGDYDGNGTIDGHDFLKWQRDGGTAAQLAEWEAHYGNSGPGGGWEESGGVDTDVLSELFLLGDSTIGAGASIDLGLGFKVGMAQDLVFRYRTDTGGIIEGLIAPVPIAAASAVPEPSSFMLIAVGLLDLGYRRRA